MILLTYACKEVKKKKGNKIDKIDTSMKSKCANIAAMTEC